MVWFTGFVRYRMDDDYRSHRFRDLSICDMVSVDFALWWVLAQYMVVFFVCKQTLDKIDSNGGKLRHQLIAYAQILQLINRRNFHSELGKEMQDSLADALPSFAQLERY